MCAPRKEEARAYRRLPLVGAMENNAEVPAGQRAAAGGGSAEMGFMFKAAGLGFGVAKPCGDSERYDFILDSGKRLWRVQVKSTT